VRRENEVWGRGGGEMRPVVWSYAQGPWKNRGGGLLGGKVSGGSFRIGGGGDLRLDSVNRPKEGGSRAKGTLFRSDRRIREGCTIGGKESRQETRRNGGCLNTKVVDTLTSTGSHQWNLW